MPGSRRRQSPTSIQRRMVVFERQMVESMRDQLRTALERLELREEEVRDLRDRNAHLELELQRQGRQLTNVLKSQ